MVARGRTIRPAAMRAAAGAMHPFPCLFAMPHHSMKHDPPPEAPVRPDNDDCCRSGCTPCVFDLHAQAVERYLAELRDWRIRNGGDGGDGGNRGDKGAASRRQDAPHAGAE
jgi:hypothetical protein